MSDVFISYAREDEPRARRLAAALEAAGWSVWWDRRIPHGKDFNSYIQKELDAAHCIIVIWSKASIASGFVRDEASEGLTDGRLVPTLFEAVRQPLGFRQLQAADLTEWREGSDNAEFSRLLDSIRSIIPQASDRTDSPRPSSTPQPPFPTAESVVTALREKMVQTTIEGIWASPDGADVLSLHAGRYDWDKRGHRDNGMYIESFDRTTLILRSAASLGLNQIQARVHHDGDSLTLTIRHPVTREAITHAFRRKGKP